MKLMLKKIFLVSLFSLSIEAADIPNNTTQVPKDSKSCCLLLREKLTRKKQPQYSDRFIFTCTWALIIGGFASAWLESLKYLAKENDRRMFMATKFVTETNDNVIAMFKQDIENAFTEQNALLEDQNAVLEEILKKLQNLNRNNAEILGKTEKETAEYYYLAETSQK